MLANGHEAKIGSITASYEHFHQWKRLAESEPGIVDMETLLKGICDKKNFIDILKISFYMMIVPVKKEKSFVNHQFLGVNQIIKSLQDE